MNQINTMAAEAASEALAGIVEHSPWVAAEALDRRPFESREALHEAMMSVIRAAPRPRQLALLRAHPELAGAAARAKAMTEASIAEQGSLGLSELEGDDQAAFDRLNADYRAKFGFPFIIAVRAHSFAGILAQFRARLENGLDAEVASALDEVAKITRFRLEDLIRED